jgi:hypothetical protein
MGAQGQAMQGPSPGQSGGLQMGGVQGRSHVPMQAQAPLGQGQGQVHSGGQPQQQAQAQANAGAGDKRGRTEDTVVHGQQSRPRLDDAVGPGLAQLMGQGGQGSGQVHGQGVVHGHPQGNSMGGPGKPGMPLSNQAGQTVYGQPIRIGQGAGAMPGGTPLPLAAGPPIGGVVHGHPQGMGQGQGQGVMPPQSAYGVQQAGAGGMGNRMGTTTSSGIMPPAQQRPYGPGPGSAH